MEALLCETLNEFVANFIDYEPCNSNHYTIFGALQLFKGNKN